MDFEDIKGFLSLVLFLGAIIFFLLWIVLFIFWNIENVPLKVSVDDKLIYEGRSACVDVSSSGNTTNVTISGGWYCLFPKEKYTSKNVKVETMK